MCVIVVDPDLTKSGVALYDGKAIKYFSLGMPSLIETIYKTHPRMVIVEAGWLNAKSNFHGHHNSVIAERIAKNVGENHASGKILLQFLEHWHVPYRLQKPLKKMWSGKDGKITQDELNSQLKARNLTPLTRSNQDQRDAIWMLLNNL